MMKIPFKERVFLSLVVAVLAGVLVTLAVLQYRWSNEVSAATSARLQANLESHMFSWRDDLSRELTGVLTALQANPNESLPDKAAQYAQEYQTWNQTAAQTNLVSGILLLEAAGTEHARLLQLNTASNEFEPVDWPAGLKRLHNWLDTYSPEIIANANLRRSMRSRGGLPPAPSGEEARPRNRRWFNGPYMDVAMIDLNEMALVRRQFQQTKSGPALNWTIVLLDRKVLQEHVLPEITERYFSGSEAGDYQVAVVSLPGKSLVYSSDSGFGNPGTAADGMLSIFGPPRGPGSRKGAAGRPAGPPPRNQESGQAGKKEAGPVYRAGVLIPLPGQESDWQLLARHRNGSLEAVVANLRRRNLAFSFGVLLVLAAGIGIILISSQRAKGLARLQMDFVATVSHELRTPLAVISSAAENIADGVVAGKQQLREYGAEIKSQARQLMQLVEQILLFAATRDKRHHYNLGPLRVADVIESALKNTAGVIEAAGFTVEQDIAPNLPPVMGDLRALSHCLQNLITNAIKYGGDARWMRIRARAHEQDGHFEKAQISVEDKGLGIGSSELRRIFEPFYRSRATAAAQIHGTGLGLSLARDIAEAMGGSLAVTSEPGKGSCFTIYLPFADVSLLQTHPQTATAVNPKLSKT